MKHKLLFVFVFILFSLSTICTVLGYKRHIDKNDNEPEERFNIVYEYYLEDKKLSAMPVNTVTTTEDTAQNNSYLFNRYTCTDGITGNFDNKNWKFNADGNDGTCKIYFVNSKYEVMFNVINGLQDENNDKTIDREENGVFKIVPNEGYEFADVKCANEKKAIWNESDHTINIDAITSDIACSVIFEKKELDVEIEVINGKGNTKETVLYGSDKTILIEPSVGYEKPTINCTNEQIANYDNKSLVFDKITNNTKCTVSFNKIKLPTYNITITNLDEFKDSTDFDITTGAKVNPVVSGKDFTIAIRNLSDKRIKLNCGDEIIQDSEIDGITKYIFYNVEKNINCTLEIK